MNRLLSMLRFRLRQLDARGRESITLGFVWWSWLAVMLKFVAGGLTLPVVGAVPPMGGEEFALCVGALLAAWLGREWQARGPGGEQ
ncbi:MAG: hypothetical protein CVV05_15435 [Gammaproteobacteria bacterium HGW-Gammaproteobacteria-1]|nr:MAG: hypothetical protein CVV05_15435 [Gammaproteobacteria bacterium HGW-Gammaproteobacteria-1]